MFFKSGVVRSLTICAQASGNIVANDSSALFFGVDSSGAAQLRGNGCLGASRDEVLFVNV